MTLTSSWAKSDTFGLTTEIQDLTNEPKVIRLYKGDSATFDGALVPFNTLRSFSELRYNYEHLKDDYIKNGVIKDNDSTSPVLKALLFFTVGFAAGALVFSNH